MSQVLQQIIQYRLQVLCHLHSHNWICSSCRFVWI